jgi:hypothetical protein
MSRKSVNLVGHRGPDREAFSAELARQSALHIKRVRRERSGPASSAVTQHAARRRSAPTQRAEERCASGE